MRRGGLGVRAMGRHGHRVREKVMHVCIYRYSISSPLGSSCVRTRRAGRRTARRLPARPAAPWHAAPVRLQQGAGRVVQQRAAVPAGGVRQARPAGGQPVAMSASPPRKLISPSIFSLLIFQGLSSWGFSCSGEFSLS